MRVSISVDAALEISLPSNCHPTKRSHEIKFCQGEEVPCSQQKTKTKLCKVVHQPNSACVKQTNYSQVQLLKFHLYDIETSIYSSVIDLHMYVHLTEVYINCCPAGSQVEMETYNK